VSEYQYYEFQAIDRRLSAKEMGELRSYSTRARITSTGFVNDYSWGAFKGDEDALMEKYFDAFLYFANWGTRVLKLRLPSRLLDAKTAKNYCGGDSASVREKAGKIILSFVSEDDEGDDCVEGEEHLSSLVAVRDGLARGDRRALYLGWLLRVQAGALDADHIEPPVPPGLGQLTPALETLAEFLRIDQDLLHVAAEVSRPRIDTHVDRAAARAWVGNLSSQEKDAVVADSMVDANLAPIAQLLKRFLEERAATDTSPSAAPRTVGHLLEAAEAFSNERARIEAEKRAMEQARRERQAAVARAKYLDSLVGREQERWAVVEALVATKQPSKYDEAVKILVDLRDLAARAKGGDFRPRIEALRGAHVKKSTVVQRRGRAGL
jgi:hypothetical protein